MKQIMFDVDGTLLQSYEFDEQCFIASVLEVTGIEIASDWNRYLHVTDRGILMGFIERQAAHYAIGELEAIVKPVFMAKIREHLKAYPAVAVDGAKDFFEYLKSKKGVALSIATGGWAETAMSKLASAGFDLEGLSIGSSSDHHERIEIMKLASLRSGCSSLAGLSYFGDAEWDVKACEALGVNLVIVGNRVHYHQSINDFTNTAEVLTLLGLNDV